MSASINQIIESLYNSNKDLINGDMDLLMEFCEVQANPTPDNLKKFIANLKKEKENKNNSPAPVPVQDLLTPRDNVDIYVKEWLKSKTNIFDIKLQHHLDNDTAYGLLMGYVQSGKSQAQAAICMYNAIVKKQSTIWILRNSNSDKQQAISGILDTFGERSGNSQQGWIHHRVSQGVQSNAYLNCLDNSITGKTNKGKRYRQKIAEALSINTSNPSVIVAIANPPQLQRLIDQVRNLENPCFNLVIDEVHNLGPTDNKKVAKRIVNCDVLKDMANNVIGCSATSFNVLFGDRIMCTDQVYSLTPKSFYKGIDYFQWQTLSHYSTYKSRKSIIDNDPEMMPFIRKMGEKPVYEAQTLSGQMFRHPVLVLNKSSVYKNHHEEFVNLFSGVDNCKWLVISYDGDGFIIYHSHLHQFDMTIKKAFNGKEVTPTPYPNEYNLPVYKYKDLQIGDVLEHFRSLDPNVKLFSHIVIIAGKMADEGLNYVSNNYSVGVQRWHITDMYYKPSHSADCTMYIQSMRPCGNYQDNLPITIHTYKEVRDSILSGVRVMDDILTGAQELDELKEEELRSISEFSCKEMVYCKKLFPKKKMTNRLTIKKTQLRFQEDEEKEEVEDDREWGLRNLNENLKRQIRNGERAALRILRFFKNHIESGLDGVTTKEDIVNGCELQSLADCTQWDKNHTRYQILVRVGDNYKVNPDVLRLPVINQI